MQVKRIYLKDNYGATVSVSVNGAAQQVERIGTGKYEKQIKVKWIGSIGPGGIHIVATN